MIVNRIARNLRFARRPGIGADLHQVFRPIALNSPMPVDHRLHTGDQVRVREGTFRNVEGTVLERVDESRLIIAVHLVQQGVTLEIDENSLERID